MVPEEETTDHRYTKSVLKFAGLVIAFLGIAILLFGLQAEEAEASPVPNISSNYHVSSDTVWDSGSATWSGRVYVDSGVTLTMKNCKATFSGSYRYFYVYDDATLIMEGATIDGTSTGYYGWRFYWYGDATVRINNSKLKNPSYIYEYGYDVHFTNSTMDDPYYGIYTYTWGSTNWNKNGPTIKNSLFINANSYCMRIYTGTAIIEDNLFMSNSNYVMYISNSGPKIKNNTIIKNSRDGIYAYNPAGWELEDNIIQSNNGNGLRVRGSNTQTTIYNNIITNNAGSDINVDRAKIRSVNNTIGKVTASNGGEVNVYWHLDVFVEWEDGTGPVADADVSFLDAQGEGAIPDEETDSDGWVRGVEVQEYSWATGGKKMYSPYTVNATKFDIKASVQVTVNENTHTELVLDNVPPILELESPVDMMLTNNNRILVKGFTEPGATCIINHNEVPVKSSGWFETHLNFSTDGTHEIDVRVSDPSKNFMETTRNIVIDTEEPTLEITSPEEETLTNEEVIAVEGETEPGAIAQVDGETVKVDSNGKFSKLVVLEEGMNTISATVWDEAGNMNQDSTTAKLDISPPDLVILEPVDKSSVAAQDIKVIGFIEDGSTLKINNLEVRYQAGTFQHSVRLFEGKNVITIEAWDEAGNYNSEEITVTLDMNPPTLELYTPKDNTFTNQRVILVSGKTDVGSTVTVNNDEAEMNPSTAYFEKSFALKSGSNKITVTTTDQYGNSVSKSVKVVLDEDPPDLTLLTPENGTLTTQEEIRVEGIAELGAYVFVNGEELPVEDGKFTAYAELEEGENEIIVITRDDALNSRTRKVIVMRDSTVDLRVSHPYDGMYTTQDIINITGSTDLGGSVYVNENLKAPVDGDGKFKVQMSLDLGTNDIVITSTDTLGNSDQMEMTVTREEVEEPVKKVKEPEDKGATAANNTWWIAMAAFLGLVAGAAIMGGAYISTRKKMEEKTREQIEDILRDREDELAERVAAKQAVKDDGQTQGPPPPPKGYKGPPLHIPKSKPKPETGGQGGQGGPPGPPPAEGRTLSSVQGETDAPTDDSEMEIDPAIAKTEARLREVEDTGANVTKARNSLKLAKFFMSKGDRVKMDKYIHKTNNILEELGSE